MLDKNFEKKNFGNKIYENSCEQLVKKPPFHYGSIWLNDAYQTMMRI